MTATIAPPCATGRADIEQRLAAVFGEAAFGTTPAVLTAQAR